MWVSISTTTGRAGFEEWLVLLPWADEPGFNLGNRRGEPSIFTAVSLLRATTNLNILKLAAALLQEADVHGVVHVGSGISAGDIHMSGY